MFRFLILLFKKKKKKMFEYEGADDVLQDPEEKKTSNVLTF